jgi:2-deoxy-D-gluconate 3-dehydrogenase
MILDQFKLDGRVAFVTGASAGLGQAIAVALAEAGADLACHGNTRSPETTCEAIERLGRRAFPLTGDLANKETPKSLLEATLKHFGHLDILVNNAARFGAHPRPIIRRTIGQR